MNTTRRGFISAAALAAVAGAHRAVKAVLALNDRAEIEAACKKYSDMYQQEFNNEH